MVHWELALRTEPLWREVSGRTSSRIGEVEVEVPAVWPFHRFVPHVYPSVGTNPSAVS